MTTKKRIWTHCERCGKRAIGLQHYSRFYHACRNPLTGKETWRAAVGPGEIIEE